MVQYSIRDIIPFLRTHIFRFGKNANSIMRVCDIAMLYKFVWRQSGSAFFGALASAGALFYFCE